MSIINEMLLRHRARLEEAEQAMQAAKAKKEADAENEKVVKAQVKEIMTWVGQYDKASKDAKHIIIASLVDRIDVDQDYTINIKFKVSAEQFTRQGT